MKWICSLFWTEALERNRQFGLFVAQKGSHVTLSDVIVKDTLSQQSDNAFSRGLNVQEGGEVEVQRSWHKTPDRSRFEIAEIHIYIGVAPKYLELMNKGRDFEKTMSQLAFSSNGFFFDEIRFVLSDQFNTVAIFGNHERSINRCSSIFECLRSNS